jgi:hypothetical protein
MTDHGYVELPVTVRLATDADIPADSVRDAVAAAVNARLHSFGLPAQAQVEMERAGSGLEIVAHKQSLAATVSSDLTTRPLPVIAQACMTGITTELAPDPVIEQLWTGARSPGDVTPQAPAWFASMVRAVIWAGGYVGDPGLLAAAVHAAQGDLHRVGVLDTDVLAEVVMRPFIRELALAADDETLPRVIELVRGDVARVMTHDNDSPRPETANPSATEGESVTPTPAFWRLIAEGLGPLISVTPPLTFVADPDVPAGYVTVRLSAVDLGILPVPDPGQVVACVSPDALQNFAGVLGPVLTGLPDPSQTWSLIRSGSEAEMAVRERWHPIYLDHLGWGTTMFLARHRHWLPSTTAVGKILDSLTGSSPYRYSVWFARAIFSDEQVTSMLRMMLALGVPLIELPMALRDALLSLREQLPTPDGPVMTAEAAKTARRRYHGRCTGEVWDASGAHRDR